MGAILAKYGAALNLDGIPLLNSSGDFLTGVTFAAGDVTVAKDGGAPANITTLITETPSGSKSHRLALSATEMQAAEIVIDIVDQGSKVWQDQRIIIHTYGHASAWIKVDLSDTTRLGLSALPNSAAGSAGGLANATNASGQVTAASVAGDVGGKVLGGGSGTITGTGVRAVDASGNNLAPASTAVSNADLTATRIGYLDKLNITGNVASSGEVTAIQNNTRVVIVVPAQIEVPDSGTKNYLIHLYAYDEAGNMEALDSAPTITLANPAGTSLATRLISTTMTAVGGETGHYKATYTATAGDTLYEQLLWQFNVVEGGQTRYYGRDSLVVETTLDDFTAADRTALNTIGTKVAGLTFTTANQLDVNVLAVDSDAQDALAGTIDTALTAGHGAGSWQQAGVSGSASAAGVAINADLAAGASTYYGELFDVDGWDASGWTQYVWSLKADPDADSDDDALLVVRVSNPGDGGDGLQVYNRAAATDATLASLAVTIVDSDTVQVQLVVQAEAMQISPSPATKSYKWELDEWKGDVKRRVGYGSFKVERTVRRGTVAP